MPESRRKTSKQLSLDLPGVRQGRAAKEYGGKDHGIKYRRNETRPFDADKSLHITMRSEQARDERSLLHPRRAKMIKEIVFRAGRRHGVEVKKFVNVGNHLHLHIQTKTRKTRLARLGLRAFLREVGGLVARVVTGAKKGQPANPVQTCEGQPVRHRKFWDHLAWSRVVATWSEIKTLARYFRKNEKDAAHVVLEQGWPESCLAFEDPGG